MDAEAVLRRLNAERESLHRAGEVVEAFQHLVRKTIDGELHEVSFSLLSDQNADRVIEEQVRHFRDLNVSFEWKVYGCDGPSDLLGRLQRHGFEIGAKEALVVFDLEASSLVADLACKVREVR